jgi:hypothetical protein
MKHRAVVAVAAAAALAASAPAAAQDSLDDGPKQPCPNGFVPLLDAFNVTGKDRNGNMIVCARTTGAGSDIFMDDRGGFFP